MVDRTLKFRYYYYYYYYSSTTTTLTPSYLRGRNHRRWGKRENIIRLHCHHQNDAYIKMGSDGKHFDVFIDFEGQSHKTVSTDHNIFEERGESKRNEIEIPLGQTGSSPLEFGRLSSSV